ncbi:DNA-directed RNA polymerase [Protomyces lactucae-debilis]|uniref:DNA-directed RNA polymerases I and III subunit RPAC2 n=1 Tax=Protomyces lactucae-debilis TaxID=2754530 RepID=A0A1Y2F0F4_PROLT|nr:DNA-directed RNA polymerase [Protomyces lactucae-debilis]ORY77362.1 DNA-directed RNA polymerase [Protomyces lactucae-debilis]
MEGRQHQNISSQPKFKILPGAAADGTASTFQFAHEDHTLGNALRYIIMKNPEVELCGYGIPHPSEPLMNLRIQTKSESHTALAALEKGLDDLTDLCDAVQEKFEAELDHIGRT